MAIGTGTSPFESRTASKAAQTPAVAAAEKSMSPIRRTMVMPTASVPTTALCMKRKWKFRALKKFGSVTPK